ncbi:hypothetical protein QBC33DRAFT_595027 [Phialemonium atrogriseum]|uniref:Uncharacterized protein n=1 Tax=Phialemonium atrogriseum TaxID=1093897 RepID=A0AAJ0FJG7_9PEZI|nr:uncharacterized protein QBC33DRAFT_595027 [Phialemonium atrogriseum]KAK1764414.1 hypothetical protein QBC33DRAFT_595027 [Phialemonium atrogriseum]
MTGVTGIALNVATKAELLPELRGDGDGVSAADDKTETLQAADAKIPLDCGHGGKQGEGAADEPELDELSERLNTGALTVSILGPYGNLARVTGHVYWDGIERETDWPSWGDREREASCRCHMPRLSRGTYESPDDEDYGLLDAESNLKFENVNPRTVTVGGFGIESWDFENTKPREDDDGHSLEFAEELDLEEIVGTLGIVYYNQQYARDPKRWIGDLYSLRNRTDVFAEFTRESSVGLQWAAPRDDEYIGIWNFLRQIIVARELAVRLEHLDGDSSYAGFTARVLASLIVSDLCLKHAEIIITDTKLQIDGAEKWPYINEVRDYAEDAYSNIRGRRSTSTCMTGCSVSSSRASGFAFKIMTALVLCTPSIKDRIGVIPCYDCSLSLPIRSYWRSRTVLGRVLGCLPGVTGLCGWIGPCPPIELDPPEKGGKKPRHVRVKARRIAPIDHRPNRDDGVIDLGSGYDRFEATRIRPGEEVDAYLADMKDPGKKLPLDVDVARKGAAKRTTGGDGDIDDLYVQNGTQYQASISFQMDGDVEDSAGPVAYKFFTNPIFVTPPPCQGGPHEVHARELSRYRGDNVWPVARLKGHTPEDVDVGGGAVVVINATGRGAEVLARAWCSERGGNAVIRRAGGPCFVCAVCAAGKGGLGTGVLIWVG